MTRKAVLVTGGAKRIGEAICQCFAEAGWHVIVHYRQSHDAAAALAATLPSAQTVACDLADADAVRAMVGDLAAQLDDWACVVSSASVFGADRHDALDEAVFAQAMQVNALGAQVLAQAYLAQARATAGRRVIQLTDQKLDNLNPDFFSYTMSKAAVDVACRMLAMAHDGGDKVFCLAPGAILPSHDQSADEAETSHRLNLLERRTQAREVADAALFLASAPLATGQTLHVDSGQHLLAQGRDVIYLAREGTPAT